MDDSSEIVLDTYIVVIDDGHDALSSFAIEGKQNLERAVSMLKPRISEQEYIMVYKAVERKDDGSVVAEYIVTITKD